MVKKQETVLTITKEAAEKIKVLAKEEKKEGYGLKLIAFSGGCSGVQYGMDFEKKPAKEDIEISQHGLKIFLPKECIEVIKGSKIDFVETKEATGFKIENPNVFQGGCGCESKGKKKEESCCGEGSCNC
jgi:iron-sulfur cluster assembly accessory protein